MKRYLAVFGVLAVVLAVLVLLSISFQRTIQLEAAEQINRQQLLLAGAEISSIQTYLAGVTDELRHVANTISLFRAYREVDYALLSDPLFRGSGKARKRLAIHDRSGNIIYSKGDLAANRRAQLDIAKLAKQLCPGGVLLQQDTRRYSVIAPVCRPGNDVGAVMLTIDIQDLADAFLGPVKAGSRGHAWLMDAKGNLLYHPSRPDMVGKNLHQADASCFGCHTDFSVEKRIVAQAGEATGRYIAPTGEDRILAFANAQVGDERWIVAVSSPYTEVTAAISRSLRLFLGIIVLIFLATGGVAVFLFMLDRKREQAEARARHEQALEMMHAEKLASLDRLTSGITSEIGNPLTSVFSFVQVLMDMEEDEFKKETLETVFFHMTRIQDILHRLSSFSKAPQMEVRPWKLNGVIENTLSLIQYDKRVQDITIVRELASGLPEVATDGGQLSHAMVNIVLNAADAMPNGGTLTVRSRMRGREAVIDFQDTGTGIGKDQLDRIFDPFYTTKAQGTGMGLTVTRNIVQKLGGRLSVESEPGKGTTFSIFLPLDRPA